MALQNIINVSIDFYDKRFVLINAKQYDKNSRFLEITCYNRGATFPINSGEHSAYIRYKKSDNQSVFNFCEINRKGKILVELTEQMLISSGLCYADLVIVNKGSANVDTETGEIVAIDNASILSTMTFCIDVSESAVENTDIESSYEFNGLNIALEKAEAEYQRVILLSKSYAIGNANGIRENEDEDNAKYYYEQSAIKASEANDSAINAATSEVNAKTSETNAKNSEVNAKTSETNAAISETNAKNSEDKASVSEVNAKTSETNAKNSEVNAKTSETNALGSANHAQSYAVGGTGTRDGEDYDNSRYYYEVVKMVTTGLNGFIPIATINFSELASVEKVVGYTYNIIDDFVTDDTFKKGAGISYPAGTNVYCTVDGYWDCFGGVPATIATVDEVKKYLGE